jgi:hypothetical protein
MTYLKMQMTAEEENEGGGGGDENDANDGNNDLSVHIHQSILRKKGTGSHSFFFNICTWNISTTCLTRLPISKPLLNAPQLLFVIICTQRKLG